MQPSICGHRLLGRAVSMRKKAYDTWVAEATKLSEIYVGMARDAYTPVEQAVAKKTPKTASLS